MAGLASVENGKKGGRPKGFAALESERARIMICERLATEFAPILDTAIEQAKTGNKDARDWLTDRAYGKPKTSTELTGKDGEPLFRPSSEEMEKVEGAINNMLSQSK